MSPFAVPSRREYEAALLAECRMLIDFLAAQPGKHLRDIALARPDGKGAYTAQEALTMLGEMEMTLDSGDQPLTPDQCAALNLLRDAIVAAADPATGTTVAFTAMVAGDRRSRAAQSRKNFAEIAYPGLRASAIWFRWFQRALVTFAVVTTLIAVWYSTKVAMGKQFLQTLDGLRIEQKALSEEKLRLEAEVHAERENAAEDRHAGPFATLASGSVDEKIALFSLCDQPAAADWFLRQMRAGDRALPIDVSTNFDSTRPGTLAVASRTLANGPERLKIYGSSAQRDICQRDYVLGLRFVMLQQHIRNYIDDWPVMAGAYYRETGWALAWAERRLCGRAGCGPRAVAPANSALASMHDVEFTVAPDLLVWGNYVMPVIFGLLGSLVYVVLDLYGRTRASRLDPRDTILSFTRMVLGLVTGACVGLFFSTYSPTTPAAATDLVGALTLSASGLAFIAGFGVEGVFSFLQGLVGRVFPTPANAR